jgi:SAM-dependent methyltransferase
MRTACLALSRHLRQGSQRSGGGTLLMAELALQLNLLANYPMRLYEVYLFPLLLDFVCGLRPLRREREQIIPLARGQVLEVGIGTGRNIPFYDASKVERLWGLDPAVVLFKRAAKRAAESHLAVEFIGLSAEQIPMADHSFDTAVITCTLCSVPDAAQVLREIRRVLKAEGELLFCEHGRAPDAKVCRWQDRLTPLWRTISGGCHLNRPVSELIQAGGFQLQQLETRYLSHFRSLSFIYRGVAVPLP